MFSRKILGLYNIFSLKWAKLMIFRRNFKNEISRWVGNFYNWIFPTLFFRAVKTIPCSLSCTIKYKPLFCYSIWFNTGETYRFSMHKSTIVDINIFWPRPHVVILDSQPLLKKSNFTAHLIKIHQLFQMSWCTLCNLWLYNSNHGWVSSKYKPWTWFLFLKSC